MQLDFIDIGAIDDAAVNMRAGRKPPDVADILPTVRTRGILVPIVVRAGASHGRFELVAGRRRVHAARLALAEPHADPELARVPAAIIGAGDDAAALEASLIENLARLDPDEVTQWEGFVRLVKADRTVDDIAATFGLPRPAIRRVLALGNLLPRIRRLYRAEQIDRTTVRHLTLASKDQQHAWLALHDDPQAHVPSGHQLKAWLFGGQSIAARVALFDLAMFDGATVADLFGEDRYFADPDAFWRAQDAAVAARRDAYLADGWSDVVVVPPSARFDTWDHERTAKRRGGRVYIDVRPNGEVMFHEGYVTRAEARCAERGDPAAPARPPRAELTASLQAYVDLHRHAAVRCALLDRKGVALRLMVAHAIAGAPPRQGPEPRATRDARIAESVEASRGETVFDERRRAVLALLGLAPDAPTVTGGDGDGHGVAGVFARLMALPDPAVLDVVAVVAGETLAAGSAAVAAAGAEVGIDMADWWCADNALFALLRDRELLAAMLAEVAGDVVAGANAGQKADTLKRIIADHLAGTGGRPKVERWVPRWMRFPAGAYTARGGVGSVTAQAEADAARAGVAAPVPEAPAEPFAEAA